MKKCMVFLLLTVLLLTAVACGKKESNDESTDAIASKIMDEFVAEAPNCGKYEEYDKNNDPNNLLGRPNQYNQKINFEVKTVMQTENRPPKGGSIEVFDSEKDAINRKKYIESLGEQMTFLAEYDYVNKNVLLRMDYEVGEDDYNQYKAILDNYIDQLTSD